MPNEPVSGLRSQSTTPFFQTFQKEMNQLLDRFKGANPLGGGDLFAEFESPVFPAIDVAETEKAVEITAEVPGVKEGDLEASISGDVLTIKGEKRGGKEEKGKDYHFVERRYGSFRRQIPLGFTPEDGAVDAKFKDGVLSLRVAKPENAAAGVKKIQISTS